MSDNNSETSRPPQYRVSALLSGHTDDVRAVAGDPSSRLFSSSRDGTARSWIRKGPREGTTGGWEQEKIFTGFHEGFINSVAWLPPPPASTTDETNGAGHLLTGGQDAVIQVWPLDASSSIASTDAPAPLHTLLGHSHNVCALHTSSDGQRIVSGSWDMTARVWTKEGSSWTCQHVLTDHGAAVWDVLAVDKLRDTVITACADGLLRRFEGDKRTIIFKGHTGPVRALAKILPEDPDGHLFASASNDGTIRIWNFDGDEITKLPGHGDSFIYSLISIPSASGGGLASSGEDGELKIWNDEDGEEDQSVLVPALSLWTLTSLANGDLAVGCSDNLIWIFTRDDARVADETTRKDYEQRLAVRKVPSKATTSSAPTTAPPNALETPGQKQGELKLIESEGKTHAYQWDGTTWEQLGEVVNEAAAPPPSSAAGKTEHEGQEYDFVFSIDVKDDEPPLKLPYNLSDDVFQVATDFVALHKLPESYTEQIMTFIRASSA